MGNSKSYYDALSICVHLDPVLDSIAPSEIYLFAYLACLLALYRDQPVADWGYEFGAIDAGYPYSPTLDESIKDLVNSGRLQQGADGYLHVTTEGEKEFGWLLTLSVNFSREECIAGACDSALSLPLGVIKGALDESRDIHSARTLSYARLLPSDAGRQEIHDQFDVLSQAVGIDVEDLMVPAVVWLQFLATIEKEKQSNNKDTDAPRY